MKNEKRKRDFDEKIEYTEIRQQRRDIYKIRKLSVLSCHDIAGVPKITKDKVRICFKKIIRNQAPAISRVVMI